MEPEYSTAVHSIMKF